MTDTYIVDNNNEFRSSRIKKNIKKNYSSNDEDVSKIVNFLLLTRDNCKNIHTSGNKFKIIIYIAIYIIFSIVTLFYPLITLDKYINFSTQMLLFLVNIFINTIKCFKITIAQKFYYNTKLFCVYMDKNKKITIFDLFIRFITKSYWLDLKGIKLNTVIFFPDDNITHCEDVNSYKCMKTIYFILLFLSKKK